MWTTLLLCCTLARSPGDPDILWRYILTADQTQARRLQGRITDPHSTPIANAVVSIPLLGRTAVTSRTGDFVIDGLPATDLSVQVRAIGRKPVVRSVRINATTSTTLDLVLEPSIVEVGAMVVTGTPAGSTTLTPLDVDAVDPAQMRKVATASLGKSLEGIPGVANLSQGPAAGNPVLRGLSQGHVRIVRDGVPQENFQATARWFPPGNFAGVERIEVIRGPASVLYGPNAVGGAINLIPKSAPQTEGRALRVASLTELQYFGNNNERYGHTSLEAAVRPGLGLRIGANRRIAGDFRVSDVATFSESRQPRAPLFSGRLPFTAFEQDGAYGQVGASGRWGQVYANHDWWRGRNNFLNLNGTATSVAMRNTDTRLRGTLLLGDVVLTPTFLLQRAGILRNTQGKTYGDALRNHDWNQELLNEAATARLELQHPRTLGARGTLGAELNRQDVTVRKSNVEPSSFTRNIGVFAFEEWGGDRLNLSAGMRFDHRQLDAVDNPLVQRLPDADRAKALSKTFSALTGSVGIGLRVRDPLTLAVNASSGFRPPAPLDLYSDEFRPVLGSFVEGNPMLRSERSYSMEASARWQSPRVSFSSVAYQNRLNGYVYLEKSERTRERDRTQVPIYVNTQTDGVVRGIEMSGTAAVSRVLSIDGNWSIVRGRNRATGEALPLMPADQGRLSVRYSPERLAWFGTPYLESSVRHVRAKSIASLTEPFADAERNPMGPGVGSTDRYTLLAIGAGGRVGTANPIDIHLAIENLLDTAYRDFLDTLKGVALGQGRNLSLRLAVPISLTR